MDASGKFAERTKFTTSDRLESNESSTLVPSPGQAAPCAREGEINILIGSYERKSTAEHST